MAGCKPEVLTLRGLLHTLLLTLSVAQATASETSSSEQAEARRVGAVTGVISSGAIAMSLIAYSFCTPKSRQRIKHACGDSTSSRPWYHRFKCPSIFSRSALRQKDIPLSVTEKFPLSQKAFSKPDYQSTTQRPGISLSISNTPPSTTRYPLSEQKEAILDMSLSGAASPESKEEDWEAEPGGYVMEYTTEHRAFISARKTAPIPQPGDEGDHVAQETDTEDNKGCCPAACVVCSSLESCFHATFAVSVVEKLFRYPFSAPVRILLPLVLALHNLPLAYQELKHFHVKWRTNKVQPLLHKKMSLAIAVAFSFSVATRWILLHQELLHEMEESDFVTVDPEAMLTLCLLLTGPAVGIQFSCGQGYHFVSQGKLKFYQKDLAYLDQADANDFGKYVKVMLANLFMTCDILCDAIPVFYTSYHFLHGEKSFTLPFFISILSSILYSGPYASVFARETAQFFFNSHLPIIASHEHPRRKIYARSELFNHLDGKTLVVWGGLGLLFCWCEPLASLYYIRKALQDVFSEKTFEANSILFLTLSAIIVSPRAITILHSKTLRLLQYVCADFGRTFNEWCGQNPLQNKELVHYLEHTYFHAVDDEAPPGDQQGFSCETFYRILIMGIAMGAIPISNAYMEIESLSPYWGTCGVTASLSTGIFLMTLMPGNSWKERYKSLGNRLDTLEEVQTAPLRNQAILELRIKRCVILKEAAVYFVLTFLLGVGSQWSLAESYASGDTMPKETRIVTESEAGALYACLALMTMPLVHYSVPAWRWLIQKISTAWGNWDCKTSCPAKTGRSIKNFVKNKCPRFFRTEAPRVSEEMEVESAEQKDSVIQKFQLADSETTPNPN